MKARTSAAASKKVWSSSCGFSLVEILVVLAITSLLAVAATPGFMSLINGNRLAGTSNELIAVLQSARLEAIRRGLRVVVCPSNDGATCSAGAKWNGLLSFEDADGDAIFDGGETVLRSHLLTPPLELWASSNISADSRIVFRPDGFAYDKNRTALMAGKLRVCIPAAYPSQNARDVSLAAGGRIVMQAIDATGFCNAPANP
jgi:type IV fimbrial biogenesis protein FimT